MTAECPGWDREPRSGEIVTTDIVHLPWPDNSFDAVIDSEAVYCNDFDTSCLIYREMHRVARPGAKLFVRTFATGTWGDGIGEPIGPRRFVADEGPLAGKGPSRFTAPEELTTLLTPWQIIDVEVITRSMESQREHIREWIVQGVKA